MKSTWLVVLAGITALLLVGAGCSTREVTPLAWESSTQGLPVLTVGRHDVWIGSLTLKPGAPRVWHVDPARATVRATPITRSLLDLFPGNGTLWASALPLQGNRLLLYWVDVKHGFRFIGKAVPKPCRQSDGGHSVVYLGRLWLACDSFGIYVFASRKQQPVQRIHVGDLASLLPASNGLWAANSSSLTAVAGRNNGTVIPLPPGFVVAGDYASNVGWAVAGTTAWAIGRGPTHHPELLRIDLRRRIATRHPIDAPVGTDGYLGSGIAVAGDEIWLGDNTHVRLIRYSGAHPGKPLGYIPLPGHGHTKDAFFRVEGGVGAVWVTTERPDGFALFRVRVTH